MDPMIRLSGAATGSLPLTGVGGIGTGAQPHGGGPAGAAGSCASLCSEAVNSVGSQQRAAGDAMLNLASGQPGDVHDVTIAREQASLGLQRAVQARGKMIEAYQDIMRMQV